MLLFKPGIGFPSRLGVHPSCRGVDSGGWDMGDIYPPLSQKGGWSVQSSPPSRNSQMKITLFHTLLVWNICALLNSFTLYITYQYKFGINDPLLIYLLATVPTLSATTCTSEGKSQWDRQSRPASPSTVKRNRHPCLFPTIVWSHH